MKEILLIKDGEIALKGLNKSTFENILIKNIRRRIEDLGKVKVQKAQSTIYVKPESDDYDMDEALERLKKVFGIAALSKARVVEKDFEKIKEAAVDYLSDLLPYVRTFKVEAKRADKSFPMTSPQISAELGGVLLSRFHNLKVNVKEPDVVVTVEVRDFVSGAPSFIPLAGPANKQGRIAADNITGIASEYTGTQGSAVLKLFDMTVATTGLNERTAAAAGIDYDKTFTYSASHASYYPGAMNMSVKALWDKKTLKILGAQIVGFDGVDKRLDVIASAIRFGAKITDLTELELCYAPPFGSAKDPVNMLGFVAENIVTGKVKQFFPEEVASLPRDGSVTLLDVRTDAERARGSIDGFMHIPLDSLRGRISEIPKGKPVYVHCHSGLRSYIACRILAGMGYDCHNLAGGWRLYELVVNERAVPEYRCTE